MAIDKKPSVEALISNAVDLIGEKAGAIEERIEVLPHLIGDTLASAKEDLQRVIGQLKDARLSVFNNIGDIFNKDEDPVIEFHDEGMTRLLADLFKENLTEEDYNLLTHDNGRPVGAWLPSKCPLLSHTYHANN